MTKKHEKNTKYTTILNFPLVNAIFQSNKSELIENKLNNTGEIEKNKVTLRLENYIESTYNLQTVKILILALEKLAEKMPCKASLETIEKNRIVEITLDEYMERCNITSRNQARNQLNKTIRILTNDLKLSWTDSKHNIIYKDCRIFKEILEYGKNSVQYNRATIQFDFDFAKGLSYGYIMPLDRRILLIDIRKFPTAIPMALKMTVHKNMNVGKTNEDIISVKTLLNALADLPRYENLKIKTGISRKIIKPFINSLEQLVNVGIIDEFTFFEPKGKEINIKVLERMRYEDFKNWNVHFKINDFPRILKRRPRGKKEQNKKAAEGEKKENL